MRLRYLIQKEFIQIRRNSFLPKMIVMFPVFLICIAPWITNMEVKNIKVCLVDNDHSQTSMRLVHRIEQSRYFIFQGMARSYADAHREVERGNADVVAVIPPDYEKDLAVGRRPQLYIAANSVNGTKGMMGASYLQQIVQNSQFIVHSYDNNASLSNQEAGTMNSKLLYNPHQDYKLFMIPALMAILIVMMCGFMPALNIVGEKEAGTIEQINVTPVHKWEFILAKLVPYWLIGLFVLTISLLLSWLVYGITPTGSLLLIYLAAMLLAFIMSGIGLIVSNYSEQMMQAMLVMWFCLVCFILLSGLFTPVQSMPQWAQTLTLVNPMRHFIDAMRTVFVRGGVFQSILPQLLVLTGMAVVINCWAVASYRKNQ